MRFTSTEICTYQEVDRTVEKIMQKFPSKSFSFDSPGVQVQLINVSLAPLPRDERVIVTCLIESTEYTLS